MAFTIDENALYSSGDLADMGVSLQRQSTAITRGELKPIKQGTRTYSGSEVKRFLGIASATTARPAASTPRAATTPSVPSATATRADASFDKFLRSGGAPGVHVGGGRNPPPNYQPHVSTPEPDGDDEMTNCRPNAGPREREFFAAVDREMANGLSRERATAKVVHEQEALHRAMIQECNANRRAR